MVSRIRKHSNIILRVLDVILIIVCYLLSTLFINNSVDIADKVLIRQILMSLVFFEIFLNALKLYQNLLRYEIGSDYVKYALCALMYINSISIFDVFVGYFSLYFKINILAGLLTAGIMIMYRLFTRNFINGLDIKNNNIEIKKPFNLLIVGAGSSGREIVLTIKSKLYYKYNIIGLIDDDDSKQNHKILDVKVLGNRYDIKNIVRKYDVDMIFFAINKISPTERKKIIEICQKTNAKIKVLPPTEDIIDKHGAMNSLREVQIEDLLGRDAIEFDDKDVKELMRNKTVLVTGGGGSIGSELCRQIAMYKPKQLIILDIYENNLYDIQMELERNYPKLDLVAIVGSVRDKERLDNVFSTYRPEIVFHAAAHKHVPLMEANPLEAIKNNIFGTYNTAHCADKYKVKKFVLISTDKAVNPTNVMGASKRVCEMIIQTLDRHSKTNFVAVRFGNVLGSNGSVIPLFKKQIENGGPVTVTHKEITRFFMTIPEAVQLILQALTYANGGEIFVLDMGEPVKIYDLAVDLIKLMGYEPNVDMMIKVTGLRPGEKLYEELLMSEEGLTSTKHNKIFISNPLSINEKKLKENLKKLKELEYNDEFTDNKVVTLMRKTVPTYKDNKIVNRKKKEYDLREH